MLFEEAENWWNNTRKRIEIPGTAVTWEGFKTAFLEKYFLADVRCKKEMEFLELKQGNMSVAEYASKFDNKILIEEGIIGRELECAVLGNEEVTASCVGEVKSAEEFYSYDAKYNNEVATVTFGCILHLT